MRQHVTRHIKKCSTCQQAKTLYHNPGGLLQPLPVLSQVWKHVTTNFIQGLPKSERVECGYNFGCGWSLIKYFHFDTLKHPFTTITIAAMFIKEIIKLHGFPTYNSCSKVYQGETQSHAFPTSIIFDRDKKFMSFFWREMFRQHCYAVPLSILKRMGNLKSTIRH